LTTFSLDVQSRVANAATALLEEVVVERGGTTAEAFEIVFAAYRAARGVAASAG
jgi:hypothetical protein